MTRAALQWQRFWFAPESARNLAAARVLFAVHALWILLSRDWPAVSGLPREIWAAVPETARWRFLVWEGHPGLEWALQAVTIAALVSAALGIWPRAACLTAGLLLYHLAPLETLFFNPSPWVKGLTPTVPALIAFGLAPCGDVWALSARRTAPPPSGEYGWALRFAQLLVCQIYFFSGYSKVMRAGWGWASGENIRDWMLLATQQDQRVVFDSLGPWLAARPLLCSAAGAFALALDLGFILVLVSRRARVVLPLAAVAFHAGILLSLNYVFLNLPHLLLFVDWDKATGSIRKGTLEPEPTGPCLPEPLREKDQPAQALAERLPWTRRCDSRPAERAPRRRGSRG